jgi:hypothetical protein
VCRESQGRCQVASCSDLGHCNDNVRCHPHSSRYKTWLRPASALLAQLLTLDCESARMYMSFLMNSSLADNCVLASNATMSFCTCCVPNRNARLHCTKRPKNVATNSRDLRHGTGETMLSYNNDRCTVCDAVLSEKCLQMRRHGEHAPPVL